MPAYVGPVDGRIQDVDLEDAVRQTILRYGTLRLWGHAFRVEANNGAVRLIGHVRTVVSKETAERIVRQVPGVREIRNELYVDTDLEIAVARALAEDPRTVKGFPGILVGSAFGEVFLKGAVSSQEIKQAASEIAARVPGVLEVTNELAAPEPPKPAAAAKPPAKPAAKPAAVPPAETETEE